MWFSYSRFLLWKHHQNLKYPTDFLLIIHFVLNCKSLSLYCSLPQEILTMHILKLFLFNISKFAIFLLCLVEFSISFFLLLILNFTFSVSFPILLPISGWKFRVWTVIYFLNCISSLFYPFYFQFPFLFLLYFLISKL